MNDAARVAVHGLETDFLGGGKTRSISRGVGGCNMWMDVPATAPTVGPASRR